MVDLNEVKDTVDQVLDHYEQEDMLKDIVDDSQNGTVCIELEDCDFDVYVSTHKDLQAKAKEQNAKVVYGNKDFASDLVDALFWIVITNTTGKTAFVVTHAYVETGEMA